MHSLLVDGAEHDVPKLRHCHDAAEGHRLDVAEAREILMKLVDTTGGTGTSKSSMREDIIRRRRTEIDTIHGAVARLGRKHGVPTSTIDTMVALVKGMQSQYLNA